ncbi:urease subunit beta [Niallia nealsonii]|uniref:Urease subunit beta n=1 Tax=Niallia nealsonii TaxID=115979 RepID=A0A2N0YZ44_9BACI|nr:urease subunit beta [Niallia nealsonii]PKG22536.1 urease subunit beta [Niallia nealsonii]
MIPGEYRLKKDAIELNAGRKVVQILVSNTGDRPIQVGSHFHFAEVNRHLSFERKLAVGMRLNIPAGTAVRFEPGEEKEVEMVQIGGQKRVYGLNNLANGSVDDVEGISQAIKNKGFKGGGSK